MFGMGASRRPIQPMQLHWALVLQGPHAGCRKTDSPICGATVQLTCSAHPCLTGEPGHSSEAREHATSNQGQIFYHLEVADMERVVLGLSTHKYTLGGGSTSLTSHTGHHTSQRQPCFKVSITAVPVHPTGTFPWDIGEFGMGRVLSSPSAMGPFFSLPQLPFSSSLPAVNSIPSWCGCPSHPPISTVCWLLSLLLIYCSYNTKPTRTMNFTGWKYRPPDLQTKHNFYLQSDLWLLQLLMDGGSTAR